MNPGLLGEKQECYAAPLPQLLNKVFGSVQEFKKI